MPIVTSGKILVTGASGYIGAWIVKSLIDANYSVLVAVRSQHQIDFIVKRFPEYEGKVTGIIVPVIEAPGAYDEAVKEVDGIIHAASPVQWTFNDPSDIIDPAVKGTTGILASVVKFGKNVKRIVITSSSWAVVDKTNMKPIEYDEGHWNDLAPRVVERDGKNTPVPVVYSASKVLAERAAWTFMEEEKPAFDLAVILPVFNTGPYIHEVTKEKGPGSTVALFLSTLPKEDTTGTTDNFAHDRVDEWVDVRDAAEHHVLALSTPAAGGERIISCAGLYMWQDFYDILNDAGFKNVPGKESYGKGKNKPAVPNILNTKLLRIFSGFKYRSLSESVREMGENLVSDGFM